MATTITDLNRTMRRIEAILNLLLEGQRPHRYAVGKAPVLALDPAILTTLTSINGNVDGLEALLALGGGGDRITVLLDSINASDLLTASRIGVGNVNTELLDQGTTLDALQIDLAALEVLQTTAETERTDQGTTLDDIETTLNEISARVLITNVTLAIIEVLQTLFAASDNSSLNAIETATVAAELTLDLIEADTDAMAIDLDAIATDMAALEVLVTAGNADLALIEADLDDIRREQQTQWPVDPGGGLTNLITVTITLTTASLTQTMAIPGAMVAQLERIQIYCTDTLARTITLYDASPAGNVSILTQVIAAGPTILNMDGLSATTLEIVRKSIWDQDYSPRWGINALAAGKTCRFICHFALIRGPSS